MGINLANHVAATVPPVLEDTSVNDP